MNFTSIKKQDTAVFSTIILVFGLALVLASSISNPTHAQQGSALAAVYGRGVHAYFAGDTSQAEQYFTQAIQGGTTDPRPYYYRAMLRLGQGRTFEAENDMRVGAAYEARNPGVQHSIGRALQRVQGPGRRTLEKFRRQARLDRLQQSQQRTQQRYEQLDRRGPAVLRSTVPTPLEQPVQPPQALPFPERALPAASAPSALPLPQPTPTVSTPQPTALPGPAGSATKEGSSMKEGSGSGTQSDTDDLFGIPAPVTPADDSFDEAPMPSPSLAEDDPFGSDAVEEAPVAETPAEETPAAETPAAEVPAAEESEVPTEADDSDPFGESTEEQPMEADTPAEEAPAEEAASEAADETPAETPDEEDDPFGDDSMEEESDSAADDSEAPADGEGDAPESDEDDPFGF